MKKIVREKNKKDNTSMAKSFKLCSMFAFAKGNKKAKVDERMKENIDFEFRFVNQMEM